MGRIWLRQRTFVDFIHHTICGISLIPQFYSNLIKQYIFYFVPKDSITPNEFYRASMSAFRRVSVRVWLRALFTLVLARVLAYPNKWSHGETMQNLLSLSASE